MPNGNRRKRYLPKGVEKVHILGVFSPSGICAGQFPFHALTLWELIVLPLYVLVYLSCAHANRKSAIFFLDQSQGLTQSVGPSSFTMMPVRSILRSSSRSGCSKYRGTRWTGWTTGIADGCMTML